MQGKPPTTGRALAHTPGRWTRCTGLHPMPDRPHRADWDGAGLDCLRSVSGKVYNFGRYIYTHLYLYFLSKPLDYSDIYDII